MAKRNIFKGAKLGDMFECRDHKPAVFISGDYASKWDGERTYLLAREDIHQLYVNAKGEQYAQVIGSPVDVICRMGDPFIDPQAKELEKIAKMKQDGLYHEYTDYKI